MYLTRQAPPASSLPRDQLRQSAEAKIRAFVLRRRVIVEDCFRDFDSLNCGKVTPPQFGRGLARIGVQLDPAEISCLCDAYATSSQGQPLCNWRDFADMVNAVFSYSIKDKRPGTKPLDAKEFLQTYRSENRKLMKTLAKEQLSDEDQKTLDATMAQLKSDAAKRRILMKPYLQDADPLHHGIIPKHAFWRALTTVGWDLPLNEMKLLFWKYASAEDVEGVDYLEFCQDVDPPNENTAPSDLSKQIAGTSWYMPKKETEENLQADADRVMRHLQFEAVNRRVQLGDVFLDNDKLRRGSMLPSRFRQVLNANVGFVISDAELNALHAKYPYAKDPSMLDYRDFMKDINSVYTISGLERHPTLRVDTLKPRDPAESEIDGNEDDEARTKKAEATDALMSRLRDMVQKRGINHKPFFAAFDKINTGYISLEHFASVLKVMQLYVSKPELELIHHRYYKGKDLVKYAAFCADLDKPETSL